MKLKHWIEILGNSIIVLAGLWVGLMVLIVWESGGIKFVESNLIILGGEAIIATAMVGLGGYHLVLDIKTRNPIEIIGDLTMIAFGVGSIWLFYQLFAHQGLFIPYDIPLLIGGSVVSIVCMSLGMNRLFNDLSKFPKVENIIRRFE